MQRWGLVLALLFGALPAFAQRTDILTGEPVRPGRRNTEIFNAPHAPRQQTSRQEDHPPVEVYVTPQVGAPYAGARR